MKSLQGDALLTDWGLDYFRSISTLGALSDDTIRYLLRNGRVLELDAGEVLFGPGDRGDSFFIVLRGRLAFSRPVEQDFAPIHDYACGTPVGYVSLIGLHNRTGRAQAADTSVVVEINAALFAGLQTAYPEDFGILLLNLSREMARTLRVLGDLLASHQTHSSAS